ncbi:MAG: hypothetical protein ACOC10_06865 [Bacteroidota bacterium]
MNKRREIPFEKYNFKRATYKKDDLPYQMGNAEMGGLVSKSGLGFEKLYFADVWDTEKSRMALPGPLFSNAEISPEKLGQADFENELTLKEGILTTKAKYQEQFAYHSQIFFSKTNPHLLCIRISAETATTKEWTLKLPVTDFTISTVNKGLNGVSSNRYLYSKISWAFSTPNKFYITEDESVKIQARKDETLEFYYSVTTQFDGENFIEQSIENVIRLLDFEKLKQELIHYSDKEYKKIASVILPDGDYAKWFYRSLFALYNTSGAQHFLPAELQFSKPSPYWNGHPFTYGQGGWGIFAFTFLGAFDKAENMAKWHYKPDVLRENVHRIFPDKGEIDVFFKDDYKGKHHYIDEREKHAFSFGHELTADGYNIPISHTLGKYPMHWDWQMHLNSFAASFFHTLSKYKDDNDFIKNYAYPVLKGTAELWRLLLNWDSEREIWYLPPLLSVSENLLEKSVLDAIVGAKWNLKTAASYAKKLNKDVQMAEKWERIAAQIYIPQNEENYLEYLDDDEKREGGGYFGIRAPMTLAFPYLELLPEVDRNKARKILDKAWKRNNEGHGMITYVSNWFALTESYLGFKEQAFKMANFVMKNIDPSGAAICEAFEYEDNDNKIGDWVPKLPYYLTGYSAFICSTVSFLIQSCNNKIKVFPCVPEDWKNVEFYDLPAEGGFKVLAKMTNGKTEWIEI